MCTSPILIRNKTKTFVAGLDNRFIKVPCGKCPECQKKRSNDLFVRSYFEFEQAKKYGGFVQMFTLTYSEKCLPFCTSRHIPCFSREDVTKFFKRLRIYLVRHYGLKSNFLRYTLCSEYGGLRQRPHYHVIFFLLTDIITPAQFKFAVCRCWQKGYVSTTKINDGVLCNTSGLAYVSKYCSKDTNTSKFFMSQIDWLQVNSPEEVEVLKKHMPFNRRSLGFGLYGFDSKCPYRISIDNIENREVLLPDYKLGLRHFSLPLYYVRKALYKCYVTFDYNEAGKKVWHTSFFLNELGKSLLSKHKDKFVTSTKQLFETSLYKIDVEFVFKLNQRLNTQFSLTSLKSYILEKSQNFSLDFCRFVVFYAPFVEYCFDEDFKNFRNCSKDIEFVNNYSLSALDLKEQMYLFNNGFDFPDLSLDACQSLLLSHLVSVCKGSSDFIDVLNIFDILFNYLNSIEQRDGIELEYSYLYRKYVYNF